MPHHWKHALILGLSATVLAMAEMKSVRGKASGSGHDLRGKRVEVPITLAVDENARIYIKLRGSAPYSFSTPFSGKDLPQVLKTLQLGIQILNNPAAKLSGGVTKLRTFESPSTASKPKKKAPPPTAKKGTGEKPEFPWMNDPSIVNPLGRNGNAIGGGSGGFTIAIVSGFGPNRRPVRRLVLTFGRLGNDTKLELSTTQATGLLNLLRMAPPTYRALLAERRRKGGR